MIHERLADLERKGTPITVGIIGAGTFGTQIIAQTCRIKGMRVAAIADLNIERGIRALKLGGISEDHIQVTTSVKQIHESIDKNISAVTSQVEEVLESDLDIIVEATGIPEVGAVNAYQAIQNKKNLVMVTVEADVLVGYLLKNMADKAGVLYSMAYGDEPALACELCDWARTLGFQLISSGKGTRFSLEFRKANPDDVPKMYGFTGKDYNASMFCSFLDGTKHSIEMAALSNATGLIPDVRGMHFPTADLRNIPDIVIYGVVVGGIYYFFIRYIRCFLIIITVFSRLNIVDRLLIAGSRFGITDPTGDMGIVHAQGLNLLSADIDRHRVSPF